MKKYLFYFFITVISQCIYAEQYFVDNIAISGENNGTSWSNAWVSFSDINWSVIQPGDVIYISGGEDSKIYYEKLEIFSGGIEDNPVKLKVGEDIYHNGTVIIKPLVKSVTEMGISFPGVSNDYIVIDGEIDGLRKIIVDGWLCGVYHGNATGITIRFIEATNNGDPENNANDFYAGLTINGMNKCIIENCNLSNNIRDGFRNVSSAGGYGSNKFFNNLVNNNGDDGMQISGNIDIYNNKIQNNGNSLIYPAGHPDGIQIEKSNVRIWNNIISDNKNSNIFVDPFHYNSGTQYNGKGYRIFNNLIYQTESSGGQWETQRGIEIKAEGTNNEINNTNLVEDVVIINNTIVNIEWRALYFNATRPSDTLKNVTVKNNLISNCSWGKDSIHVISTNSSINFRLENFNIDYNLIYSGSFNGFQGYTNISWKGENYSLIEFVNSSIGQKNGINGYDPLFSDIKNSGFYIEKNSPAIDNGLNILFEIQLYSDIYEKIIYDRQGIKRPQGFGWDIGAYEYGTDIKKIEKPSNLRIK